MKDPPMSTLERDFLLRSLGTSLRLDGRGLGERRELQLTLGADPGSCLATLGETRVLAQASSSLTEPQLSRPNEGMLRFEVEFSPMAAPRFADARSQDFQDERVELLRLLERCFRESGCLDLESLCVVSESVVWAVRVDVHVLNHEGNLAEAASAAVLASLAHFRRPEVTLRGQEVVVHPVSDRDPVPLSVHHYPVLSTFAFFKRPPPEPPSAAAAESSPTSSGTDLIVCVDPTHLEEAVMAGKLVFGANPYREVCTLHLAGDLLIDKSVILRYARQAGDHAKSTVDLVKERLAADTEARSAAASAAPSSAGTSTAVGFAAAMKKEDILSTEAAAKRVDLASISLQKASIEDGQNGGKGEEEEDEEDGTVVDAGGGVVEMLQELRANVERNNELARIRGEKKKKKDVSKEVQDVDEEEEEEEEEEVVVGGGL